STFISEFPDMAKEMAFWGNYDFIRTALSGKDALNRDFVFPKTGIIRVGAEVPIQDLGWASGSLINVDKAVGPLRRDIVIAGAITTVIALIALAVSFLVARRIIGSLSALVDKARLVGEGRFEEPVFLKTGDEVEDVARSLDETRLNLKNYIEGLSGVAETGHLLTSSVEIEGVKTAIAGAMERIFGAIAVWILIFDKETERLETFMWSGPGAEEFSRVTFRPGNGVAGKVFQTGKAAAVPDVQAEPTFIGKELASRFGIKSVIQLPLIIGEKTIGVLGMFSSVVKTSSFSAREMELMDIFASQVAAAVENTRLFQEIIRRNKELQILSEISAVVAQTLNFKKLIEQAVDKVLQLLEADAITFYLIDEESMTLKLFTHRGVGEEYLERFSVIRLRDDIKDKAAESFIPMAKAGTDRSDLSVPGSEIINGICALVKVRGKIIGAMAIGTKHRRQFAERDFDLLSAIGNQIGTAIENARLFERERDIAEVLQKSLLGRAPVIPGFEIGVAYEPALSEAAEVGGDFFDFIEFADGKTGVVIGDVSGKGIEAATLTSIAKNTVRAFAYENNSPGDVLTRVNEVLNSSTGAEEFVTLLFILLDVKSGLIRIASAAHPHAFICNGDCVLPKGGYGLPLGAFSDTKYTDTLVEIKKGQSLILYTDGLTDARSDGTMFGEEGIWRVASEYKMTMNAQELADRIVKEAKDFAGGRLVDDVAVIVLNLKK
ncbi:MAG: SpoIIE family protein phosphatase, partial [Firmicutes bacterium]|nr:SpoIIE family protein phosphatase [Bacillota bacterium]